MTKMGDSTQEVWGDDDSFIGRSSVFAGSVYSAIGGIIVKSEDDRLSGKKVKNPAKFALVYDAQVLLLTEGFNPGVADGVMGAKTRAAIESYQKEHKLSETGYLDSATLSAMKLKQ